MRLIQVPTHRKHTIQRQIPPCHLPATLFLQWAVALCFLCHGLWAIRNATIYHSEWNVWIQSLFPQAPFVGARHFLTTVGMIDIVAALCFLRRHPPRVAYAWVIPWAFATAMSRFYFLATLRLDVWQGLVAPLAEVLARVVNFGVPLLAWQLTRGASAKRIGERSVKGLYHLIVTASVVAIALRYLTTFLGPEYPYKMHKLGESLWFFHTAGLLAWAAVCGMLVSPRLEKPSAQTIVTMLVIACVVLHEGFDLGWRHLPHGFTMLLIGLGEHAPLYVAVAAWAHQRQMRPFTSAQAPVATASMSLSA